MSTAQGSDKNLETFYRLGGLSAADQQALSSVAATVVPHLTALTDRFYEALQSDPQTAPYIEGRIDALKATHLSWMQSLFNGDYGPEFIKRQEKIGEVHVRVKVPPVFVAASMSFLRAAIPPIIVKASADGASASTSTASLLRLLDLCQYLIDRKYSETLMDNLGISPGLLLRLQSLART